MENDDLFLALGNFAAGNLNEDEFTWNIINEWSIVRILSYINANDEIDNLHRYEEYNYERKLNMLHLFIWRTSWAAYLGIGGDLPNDVLQIFMGMDYVFRMQVIVSESDGDDEQRSRQIFYYNYPISISFDNIIGETHWYGLVGGIINELDRFIIDSRYLYNSRAVNVIRIDAQLYVRRTIMNNNDYIALYTNKAPVSTTVNNSNRIDVIEEFNAVRSTFPDLSNHIIKDDDNSLNTFIDLTENSVSNKFSQLKHLENEIKKKKNEYERYENSLKNKQSLETLKETEEINKKMQDLKLKEMKELNFKYLKIKDEIEKIEKNRENRFKNFNQNLHLSEDLNVNDSIKSEKKLENNSSILMGNLQYNPNTELPRFISQENRRELIDNIQGTFEEVDVEAVRERRFPRPYDPNPLMNNTLSASSLNHIANIESLADRKKLIEKIKKEQYKNIDDLLGIKKKNIFSISKVSSHQRDLINNDERLNKEIKLIENKINLFNEAMKERERAENERRKKEAEDKQKEEDKKYKELSDWIDYYNRPNRNDGPIGKWCQLPEQIERLKFIFNPKQTLKNEDLCFLGCTIAHLNNISSTSQLNKMLNDVVDEIDTRLIDTKLVEKKVSYEEMKDFAFKNKISYVVWMLVLTNTSYSIVKRLEINVPESKEKIFLLQFNDHFSLINDIDAFVRYAYARENKYLVCHLCYDVTFRTEVKLNEHIELCKSSRSGQAYKIVNQDKSIMKFKNRKNRMKHSFIVYADIESILFKTDITKASTKLTSNHKPIMVGCFTPNKKLDEKGYNFFKGEACIFSFLAYLSNLTNIIRKTVEKKWIKISEISSKGEKCFLCDNEIYINSNCIKIEKGQGMIANNVTLHDECYKKFTPVKELVVIFHNLKGYDAHFIVDEFSALCTKFFSIPKTKEKYTFFSGEINKVKIKFIDSFAFLQKSLSKLADGLDKNNLKFIKGAEWENFPIDVLGLKIPFPYEYIDSIDKLECQSFPENISCWNSSLTKSRPPLEKIKLAQSIFKAMNCKSIGEYMEIYLKVDVYILAEIFEDFRIRVLKDYQIDPCHYYTTPGLAWDCAFSYITLGNPEFGLELLTKENLISFFIEYGVIRGGISTVSSEKYCNDLKEDESIEYLDVTNLYGYAMTFPLPYGDFEFIEDENMMGLAYDIIREWDDNCMYGYILEIDAHIDPLYHDYYNDLPPLPSVHNFKLSPNFYKKVNYKTHICLLQQAYRFGGLIITNVSRILKFKQACWLKGYIEFNTKKRSESKNDADKDFYKLMNNSVYGKTMENVLKRSKYKFYSKNDKEKMIKDYHNYNLKYYSEFTPNIYITEETGCPFFDKPIYVGFVVLEYSKRHIYYLLYKVIKPRLKISLMYMDTDSFIIHAKEKIRWEDFSDWFDLSSIGIKDNKGRLGTLKNEYPNKKIEKFYALCSKTYMAIFKKIKYFTLAIVKNKGCNNKGIYEEHFLNALNEPGFEVAKEMGHIRTFKHEVFTTIQTKKTIKYTEDTKRYSYNNNKNTYAFGHIGILIEIKKRKVFSYYFKKWINKNY